MKVKATKFLEGNEGEDLYGLRLGKDFLNRTLKAVVIKDKINKLDVIKIKNFRLSKDNIKRMKRKPQTGRRYM